MSAELTLSLVRTENALNDFLSEGNICDIKSYMQSNINNSSFKNLQIGILELDREQLESNFPDLRSRNFDTYSKLNTLLQFHSRVFIDTKTKEIYIPTISDRIFGSTISSMLNQELFSDVVLRGRNLGNTYGYLKFSCFEISNLQRIISYIKTSMRTNLWSIREESTLACNQEFIHDVGKLVYGYKSWGFRKVAEFDALPVYPLSGEYYREKSNTRHDTTIILQSNDDDSDFFDDTDLDRRFSMIDAIEAIYTLLEEYNIMISHVNTFITDKDRHEVNAHILGAYCF